MGRKKKKKSKQKQTKIIKGMEIVKKTRVPYDPSFKSGRHMTEKDRPRKKIKPADITE